MKNYKFEMPNFPIQDLEKCVDLLHREYKNNLTLGDSFYKANLSVAYANELSTTTTDLLLGNFRNEVLWYVSETRENEHPYYFHHIPRCGGNTIKNLMKSENIYHTLPVDKVNPEINYAAHISALKGLSDSFSFGAFNKATINAEELKASKVKVFSTVRNPFSWLVSMYFFGPKESEANNIYEAMHAVYGVGNVRRIFSTFGEFFDFFISDVSEEDPLSWLKPFRQNPYFQLWDEHGNLIPDKIIKLENMSELKDYLGLECEIPVQNAGSSKLPYQKYYTEDMVELFREKYGKLLNYFDYDFEELDGE